MAPAFSLQVDSYEPQISFPAGYTPPDPTWRAPSFVAAVARPAAEGDVVGIRFTFQPPGNVLDAVRDYSTEMVEIVQKALGNAAGGNIADAAKEMLNQAESVTTSKSFALKYQLCFRLSVAKSVSVAKVSRFLDYTYDTEDAVARYSVDTKIENQRLPSLKSSTPRGKDSEMVKSQELLRFQRTGGVLEVVETVNLSFDIVGLADQALKQVKEVATAISDFAASSDDETSQLKRGLKLLTKLVGSIGDLFKDKAAKLVLNTHVIEFESVKEEKIEEFRTALESAVMGLEQAATQLDAAYEAQGFEAGAGKFLRVPAESLRERLKLLDP